MMEKYQDILKRLEDEVITALEAWPRSKQLIAYVYLNGQGIRVTNIDLAIARAIKEEEKT